MAGELVPLTVFSGVPIHADERQLVSLTDLWRAAGEPANRDPRQWRRKEGASFIRHLSRKLNVPVGHILVAARGRNGGTWAHWKVALDYAAYLSEPLKDHIYEVFRERIEEEANPELAFERWRERAERLYARLGKSPEWTAARLRSIINRHLETDTLKAHGITEGEDYARITNATYRGLYGHSAQKLKELKGVPQRANLRDHFDEVELLSISLAETLARHKIRRGNLQGVRACAAACRSSAENVAAAIAKDMAG